MSNVQQHVAYSKQEETGKPLFQVHAYLESTDREEQRTFFQAWQQRREEGIRVVSLDGFRRFNSQADEDLAAFLSSPTPTATQAEEPTEEQSPNSSVRVEQDVEAIAASASVEDLLEAEELETAQTPDQSPSERLEPQTIDSTPNPGDVREESSSTTENSERGLNTQYLRADKSGSIFQSILEAVRDQDPPLSQVDLSQAWTPVVDKAAPDEAEEHRKENRAALPSHEVKATERSFEPKQQENSMEIHSPIESTETSFDSTSLSTRSTTSQLNHAFRQPVTLREADLPAEPQVVEEESIAEDEPRRRGRPLKHNKPLRTRMGFRISDEMLQEVEAVCDRTGLSKTDLILQAIQNFLDDHRSLN